MSSGRPWRVLVFTETVSAFGAAMSMIALPWFVLMITGSPAQMSVVVAAEVLALAVLGAPLGAVAARLGSRRAMLWCDGVRGPLVALVPLLHMLGALDIRALVFVAALKGALTSPYRASHRAVLAAVFESDWPGLARATALTEGGVRVAGFAAAPVAGMLIVAVGAPAVLLLDALCFAACFLLLLLAVPRSTFPVAVEKVDLLGGLRALMRDRMLGAWTLTVGGFEFAWTAMVVCLPVLVTARFAGGPEALSVLVGAAALGCVAGSAVNVTWVRGVDSVRFLAWVRVPQALPFWALTVVSSPGQAAVVLGLMGFGNGLVASHVTNALLQRLPSRLHTHGLSAFASVTLAIGGLGLAAAGPVMEAFGASVLVVGMAVIQTICAVGFIAAAVYLRRPESRQLAGSWSVTTEKSTCTATSSSLLS